MVDSTTLHRRIARLAFAGLCPRTRPCRQQGLRPASAACSTIRTPEKRHTAAESTIWDWQPGSVPPPVLLEFEAMRLEGIQAGDIVEVDRKGRRFHALVTGTAPGGLAIAPTDRRVNYYSCRSREVVGHWAKRGRPRTTTEPLLPSPRQLQMDLVAEGEAAAEPEG